jgi:Tol biopolymer transport system component
MQLARNFDIIVKYLLFLSLILGALTGSCAKTQSAKKGKRLVTERQAFRFPQQNFIHPLLSPDDKWVIYHSTDIDWSRQKFSEFLFGRVRTVCWKKVFYTEIGRSDKKLVPLFPVNEKHKAWSVGYYKKWSPDGKVLALTAEIDGEERIVLVSFSGDKPRFKNENGSSLCLTLLIF